MGSFDIRDALTGRNYVTTHVPFWIDDQIFYEIAMAQDKHNAVTDPADIAERDRELAAHVGAVALSGGFGAQRITTAETFTTNIFGPHAVCRSSDAGLGKLFDGYVSVIVCAKRPQSQ